MPEERFLTQAQAKVFEDFIEPHYLYFATYYPETQKLLDDLYTLIREATVRPGDETERGRLTRPWREEVDYWLDIIISAASNEDGMDGSWADKARKRKSEFREGHCPKEE